LTGQDFGTLLKVVSSGSKREISMKKVLIASVCGLALMACTAREQRAGGGALLGGAAGAAIGGLATGRAGGALAGGIIGAAGGAIIADATRPSYRYRCTVYDEWRGRYVRTWCNR
jgi:MFS family permease